MPRVPETTAPTTDQDPALTEPRLPAPRLRVVADDDRDLRGALNLRGRDAFDLPERALSAFDKRAAEIETGLTNDAQRGAFRRLAAQRRFDINRTIQRHVAAEIRRYDDQTTDSYVANEVDGAIAFADDNERVQLGVARASAALTDYANRNGLPPEWLTQKQIEVSTKVHGGVVERLLANGKDLTARDYYQANVEAIAGSQRARIEKALEVGTLRGESQRQADAILAKHADMGEALKTARAIADPQVRDATESRVKDYFATKRAADQERERAAADQAWDILAKTKKLDAVPPGVIARMDGKQRLALEAEASAIASGAKVRTDPEAYAELQTMLSTDPEGFAALDLRTYFPRLSETDRRHFIEKQHPDKIAEAATLAQQLANAHDELGWKESDREKKGKFDKAVTLAVNEETRTKRRALTFEERQAVIDRLMVRGRIADSGIVRDTRGRLYEFAGTEEGKRFVPSEPRDAVKLIPVADRRAIVERFKAKRRREPTEAELVTIWNTWRAK